MKLNLTEILKALAWPVALIAIFSAVLLYFGISLEQVEAIAASMAGAQLLISLLVNVLKWAGVVNDGTAGKWSAAFNLLGYAAIAVSLGLYPAYDFSALDAKLVEFAQFFSLAFGYIVQIVGTKSMHLFTTRGLGVTAFKAHA